MYGIRSLMKDTVSILKSDGSRVGPYQSVVTPSAITIMENVVDVDEGDHVLRQIPSGKEEVYLVLSADYSPGIGSIPPSYKLRVRKTTAISPEYPMPKSTTININNSTGVQVGDYNTQHIQAVFDGLIQEIEKSSASAEEKAEAKGRLSAFLSHPVVATVIGSAASALLGSLGAV